MFPHCMAQGKSEAVNRGVLLLTRAPLLLTRAPPLVTSALLSKKLLLALQRYQKNVMDAPLG